MNKFVLMNIILKSLTFLPAYYLNKNGLDNFLNVVKLNNNTSKDGINKVFVIPKDIHKDNDRQRRVYSLKSKSPTILARADTTKIFINNKVRKLTPLECERLQCIPDNYTSLASDTQRYKMIGNAFTVSIIVHFFKGLKREPLIKKRIKQETLF